MTGPQPLNSQAVQRRLRAIEDRLDDLRQLGEAPVQRLRGRMGDSLSYKESFAAAAKVGAIPAELAARMALSAGLRNMLVHRYLDADLSKVADSVPMALKDYAEYVREVAAWLRQ
jgi:uncharacterized protein YutE (UPF0331/DUF86 family)